MKCYTSELSDKTIIDGDAVRIASILRLVCFTGSALCRAHCGRKARKRLRMMAVRDCVERCCNSRWRGDVPIVLSTGFLDCLSKKWQCWRRTSGPCAFLWGNGRL